MPDPGTVRAPRIPLRDFFRNPAETEFRISPDGRFIAWLAPFERRLNVFVPPSVSVPTTL